MIQRFTSLFTLILLFFAGQSTAQSNNLLPSIGIGNLPANSTEICEIPLYLGSVYYSGYEVGDTVPDFNLFDIDGNEFVLSEALAAGKPVLMVGGNYTCPIFRNKIQEVNQVYAEYSDLVEVVIIYGAEAHPINDISPYFGVVSVTNANIFQGVLFEQPKTYGQRKALVATMLNEMDWHPPIYLDGPCNEWRAHYGPAPNNAYLIGADGTVLIKHGWFDKAPDDIFCDLNAVLGIGDPCALDYTGSFEFTLQSDSVVSGIAGTTISAYGLLENNTDSSVEIEIGRISELMPAGWSTSLCTDICYSPTETSAITILGPQEFITYTNYFYTTPEPNLEGSVLIGFRNTNDFSNSYLQWFTATTAETTSLSEAGTDPSALEVYPNPSSGNSWLQLKPDWLQNYRRLEVEVLDLNGQRLHIDLARSERFELIGTDLTSGLYLLRIYGDHQLVAQGKWMLF